MKILAVQLPLEAGEIRRSGSRLFPWGFATVMKLLEDDGHEIVVFDIWAEDMIKHEVEEALDALSYDVICITGFASVNYYYHTWLAPQLRKRSNAPIVVGGLLSDLHYDLLLEKGYADVCVIGEGELTSVELLRNLDKLDKVAGIAYLDNGQVTLTQPRELIKNLDDLPMPNFDIWNMDVYTRVRMYAHDSSTKFEESELDIDPDDLWPGMVFLAGRGCPFRCKFCKRSFDSYRLKSIDRVISEIKYLKERYGLKSAHFSDETLILKKRRTLEFAKAMKEVDIYWDGQARIDTIDKDTMQALKDAKCISIGFGVESGSNKMLKLMNKGITREKALRVLDDAREVGIHLKLQFMGGYPGETKETLAETVSLLKETKLPPRRLTWCTPMPGSALYDEAIADGKIEDEEAFIIELHQGYNRIDNVVLNVSGHSDKEMIRLFGWAHKEMHINYLKILFADRKYVSRERYLTFLYETYRIIQLYYANDWTISHALIRRLLRVGHLFARGLAFLFPVTANSKAPHRTQPGPPSSESEDGSPEQKALPAE